MPQKIKSLFLVIFLTTLFIPIACAAYEYEIQYFNDIDNDGYRDTGENITDTVTASYDGLVPCGRIINVNGADTKVHCQFCHIFIAIRGIIDFLLLPPTGIVFVLAVLMIVIGGAMAVYGNIAAPGDPKVLANAQKVLTAAITGLVIIFGSWILINLFFTVAGIAEWTGLREGWFTIDCPIKLPAP